MLWFEANVGHWLQREGLEGLFVISQKILSQMTLM
jgi:hypothetical protein